MENQKKEIILECIDSIEKSVRLFTDASDRLKENGIHLVSAYPAHYCPESGYEYSIQLYSGIYELSEALDVDPYVVSAEKMAIKDGDIQYFQLGHVTGYTFK